MEPAVKESSTTRGRIGRAARGRGLWTLCSHRGSPLDRLPQSGHPCQVHEREIEALDAERRQRLRTVMDDSALEQLRALMTLQGIGIKSSWLFVMEFFFWRQFGNQKEMGSLAGLAPTPNQSREEDQSPGIEKAGNVWVTAVEHRRPTASNTTDAGAGDPMMPGYGLGPPRLIEGVTRPALTVRPQAQEPSGVRLFTMPTRMGGCPGPWVAPTPTH